MSPLKRLFICLVIITSVLFAQDNKNFPVVNSNDINGLKITRTSYYDGSALWGLIDGGADIYLEYGFDKLLFREAELNGIKFRIEIYRMNSAGSAYGIYSVSHFKCSKEDTITKYICISQYQAQASVGKYYISVSNDMGNKESNKLTLDMLTKILSGINESVFSFPTLFQKKLFAGSQNQIKLIKGNLGMQNGYPGWMDLFDGFSNYELYILPFDVSSGSAVIAQVNFSNESDAIKFAERLKNDSQKKIVSASSKNELIFIETNMKEEESKKFIELLK
jgi:hypothetical protein